jgi:antitoxin component YwqK of YwqJK toxin-antitoxin module
MRKITPLLIFLSFCITFSSLKIQATPETKLKIKQPNWRLEKLTTQKIIFYAPTLKDCKETPVKEMLYNLAGNLIQETDLIALSEKENSYVYHGPSVIYDEKGRIQKIDFYIQGILDGECKDIYPNGLVKKKTQYVSGIKQGASTVYFDNGEIAKTCSYRNGKLNGECLTYYPNGLRESQLSYENDLLQGEATYWYDNGNLRAKKHYTYGLLNDQRLTKAYTTFYPENVTQEVQGFAYGLPTGAHIKYHSNGKESYKVNYKNGKKVGQELQFSDSGILVAEGEFNNGIPTGKHYKKNSAGIIIFVGAYDDNGDLTTPIEEFDDLGNKIRQYVKNRAGLQGEFLECFSSGALKRKYHYHDDCFHGSQEEFFESGQKKLKCFYVNKKKHGPYVEWFENGQQSIKYTYNNGLKMGIGLEFYANGQKKLEAYFNDRGMQEREERLFDANGQLISHTNFINDLKNGIKEEWYSNGKIKSISHYLLDKLHGKAEVFYENGNAALKANYKEGLPDGSYITYFENGHIQTTKQYIFGTQVGTHIEYHPSKSLEPPQIAKETHYKDGFLEGTQTSYHSNGQVQAVLNYKNNVLHGVKSLYNNEGKLLEEAFYIDGKLNGSYFTVKKSGNEVYYVYKDNLPDGLHEIYFPEHSFFGKVKALEATYKAGLLEGEVSEFNEAGTKIISTFYQNGLRNGPTSIYAHDGRIISFIDFKDDLQHGMALEYYPSGRLQKEAFFVENLKDGRENIYFDNDKKKLKCSRIYKNDFLNGFWQEWDKNGALIFQVEYLQGKKNGVLSKYDADGNACLLHRYEEDILVEKFDCDKDDL